MADSSLIQTALPALIALGGTIVGLGGGLVIQLVLEGRRQVFEKEKQEYDRQKEIKRKKAEKLEELVATLHEEEEWLDRSESFHVYEIIKSHDDLDPIGRISAIISVYFPHLSGKYIEYQIATSNYKSAIFESANTYQHAVESEQQKITNKLLKHNNKIAEIVASLQEDIESYAQREFQ